MSLTEPTFLLALLVLPLVAAFFVRERERRRRYAVRLPALAGIQAATAAVPSWRRGLPVTLLFVAAVALVVALARPHVTVAVPVEQAAVMLITDQSGSMLADDVLPTRIDAAANAASSFLDRVPDELLVGFVSYSSGVEALLQPTTDHDDVRLAIASLRADGGTATGDALQVALDRLEARREESGPAAPAAIVLLSDGATTEGSDPLDAAERAADLGIPIYTVSLGTAQGIVYGPNGEILSVPPDPETMLEIAATSGGEAFAVDEGDELDRVYESLGSRIGTEDEEREISAAFAGGGLLFLLLGMGTALRWRSRLV